MTQYQQAKDSKVRSLTMPETLIFLLSKYATARGKQNVCENEPIIYGEDNHYLQTFRTENLTHPYLVPENLGRWPVY